MFSRYFLTFCVVVLVAAVASISAETNEPDFEYDEAKLEVEVRSKIVSF